MSSPDRERTVLPAPRYSLVIPAYNEAAYLPHLLDSVDRARAAYRLGPDAIEVIVSDNASTDRTTEIAAARGCRLAHVVKRVIGAARNGGAAIARGEILGFVDADMRIHPETFNEIDRALASGEVVAGATGALPDRWSPGILITVGLMLPFGMLLRVDTGVVFCRRDDFAAIGGYREDRLFAEDLAFLFALRRLGHQRRQRLTRALAARAIASTRKFDKYGDWHFFTLPFRVMGEMFKQHSAQRFAQKYWYEDR